jgi:hypothetical protein
VLNVVNQKHKAELGKLGQILGELKDAMELEGNAALRKKIERQTEEYEDDDDGDGDGDGED